MWRWRMRASEPGLGCGAAGAVCCRRLANVILPWCDRHRCAKRRANRASRCCRGCLRCRAVGRWLRGSRG